MKFSCDRCGQRYVSPDEPKAEQSYRILCLVCGATVRLKGGEFPALPTFAADPAPAPGVASPDAAAEEPVALALAPMALREPPAAARQQVALGEVPRGGDRVRRWGPLVGGSVVALATIGAGVLLISGEPGPRQPGEATAGHRPSEATADVAVRAPAPDSAPPVVRPDLAPALPPLRQSRSAAVAPAAAKRGPGQGGEAMPARSAKPAPVPPPPGPVPASSPRTASSAAHKAPSASRPTAVAPGPTATAAQVPQGATKGNKGRLSQEEVAAAIAARRPAFESCLHEALQNEPGLVSGGLRIAVIATVHPIGVVTSPQVEEPALQDTELGECLRSAARNLLFPTFEGEPFQVRIPLVLGR